MGKGDRMSYELFWTYFKNNELDIFHNIKTDTDNVVFDITNRVKAIHPELEFEITLDLEDGKRNFILSADGIKELFPIVEDVVSHAPKLDNWIVTAFRPRLYQRNQIIDLDGITLDYHDIYFSYEEQNNKLIIDVFINGYVEGDNRYIHLYFLLLDSLIGEYDAVMMIEETKVHPLQNKTNLEEFPKLLHIIDQIKER